MTEIFSYPYEQFDGTSGKLTLCSGPVILNNKQQVLLHIGSSTGKYQFIGGRLDDTQSLQENAITRAAEVLGHNDITLDDNPPKSILGEIERDGQAEKVLLFHYSATLKDESNIGEGEWKTLEEIKQLASQDNIASPNIVIASEHFLNILNQK